MKILNQQEIQAVSGGSFVFVRSLLSASGFVAGCLQWNLYYTIGAAALIGGAIGIGVGMEKQGEEPISRSMARACTGAILTSMQVGIGYGIGYDIQRRL